MSDYSLANPFLTRDLSPPPPRSFRDRQWCARGYQHNLRPISPDSELGVFIGQMGWVGSHAHTHGYLWGSAGNMGALLDESIDPDCLLPYVESPRYTLPRTISVPSLAGRRVLFTKSGARLDMISLEHPALNLAIVEVESDGIHYRMRFGTQSASRLKSEKQNATRPTSEMFHYMLIFDQLETHGFKALVHLQPKFLNLISRTEYGHPSRFYDFLKGYEPETPIMYEGCGGIGFVQERAPGIPELSHESLRLFKMEDSPSHPENAMRYILYWVGHGTFSRGIDLLDAYKHGEYFEAAARMAWEANQGKINAQPYNDEIVNCILREFHANQNSTESPVTEDGEKHGVYNYP
ncbi:MAG: class II aldolase/adducin family protein [Candidatus Poribacteria bacterium]|nr:class II aldolase/adducin family protein [Candidatus Poribacteria bacterium]MDE0506570.1 class II aldolase/adducin family protein [Candidatus Poribacteria bacterium]